MFVVRQRPRAAVVITAAANDEVKRSDIKGKKRSEIHRL